jgi:hypothetical protein
VWVAGLSVIIAGSRAADAGSESAAIHWTGASNRLALTKLEAARRPAQLWRGPTSRGVSAGESHGS